MRYRNILKSAPITILTLCVIFVFKPESSSAFYGAGICRSISLISVHDLKAHKEEVAGKLPADRKFFDKAYVKPALCIAGLVQCSMWLTVNDLSRFRQERIVIGEKKSGKNAGHRSGVSLRTLIELAKIQESDFEKKPGMENKIINKYDEASARDKTGYVDHADIAVSIKNSEGRQIVFSWDDIRSQPYEDIVIASPVGAKSAKDNGKLVQARSDLILINGKKVSLSMTGLISIEVMRVPIAGDMKDIKEASIAFGDGRAVSLSDAMKEGLTVKTNDTVARVSFTAILKSLSIKDELTDVFAVQSYNGGLTLVSRAELAHSGGASVLIRTKTKDMKDTFNLVLSNKKNSARTIKNIKSITQISLKQKPMIYVVGVGCGDLGLLTNDAVSYIGRADAFICMGKYRSFLAGYIAGRPVLFDPFMQLGKFYRKVHPELSEEEAEKAANALYKQNIEEVRQLLAKGKSVVLLEPGDPTLYGGWRKWLSPHFNAGQIAVVPGISSFSAASAMLGRYDISKTSVVITEPEDLKRDESLIQSAAKHESLMVIFMGLSRMQDMHPTFMKYYPKETPVRLVYNAGIAGKELVVDTTMEGVLEAINRNKETFLGLIFIGRMR